MTHRSSTPSEDELFYDANTHPVEAEALRVERVRRELIADGWEGTDEQVSDAIRADEEAGL